MNSHPDPGLLRAVDQDVLPTEVAEEVRAHLESCQICLRLQQDLLHPSLSDPTLHEMERLRKRILPESASLRWPIRFLAAAAVVVLGLWIWNPFASRPKQPVQATAQVKYRLAVEAAPLRLPLAAALVVRGRQEPPDQRYLEELGAAMEPYRGGRYQEAATKFAALADRYPNAVEPHFYLGVTRLLLGSSDAATAPLLRAQAIGGEALNDDIRWYVAAMRERTGAWEQAVPLLEQLCRGEGLHRQASCEALGRR